MKKTSIYNNVIFYTAWVLGLLQLISLLSLTLYFSKNLLNNIISISLCLIFLIYWLFVLKRIIKFIKLYSEYKKNPKKTFIENIILAILKVLFIIFIISFWCYLLSLYKNFLLELSINLLVILYVLALLLGFLFIVVTSSTIISIFINRDNINFRKEDMYTPSFNREDIITKYIFGLRIKDSFLNSFLKIGYKYTDNNKFEITKTIKNHIVKISNAKGYNIRIYFEKPLDSQDSIDNVYDLLEVYTKQKKYKGFLGVSENCVEFIKVDYTANEFDEIFNDVIDYLITLSK